MKVARIMEEIVIAILVCETYQSPSTTTKSTRLMGKYKGHLRSYANMGIYVRRLQQVRKQVGDEECRLKER